MVVKDKKKFMEVFKKASFLIFLIVYIVINVYLGGIVNWRVLLIAIAFVVALNIITVLLAPFIVNIEELKRIDKKLKEIQQNPFAALMNQEELLELFSKKQSLMQRFVLFSIIVFILGIYLLNFVTNNAPAWENFKIELPFIGATATAFIAYLLFTYAIFPFLMDLRRKYGLA